MAVIFRVQGVMGPSGELQVARLYAPDGSTVTNLVLTESPAGSGQFGAQVIVSINDDTTGTPYEYEVRAVGAASGAGFDASTTIRRSRGIYDNPGGFVVDGQWALMELSNQLAQDVAAQLIGQEIEVTSPVDESQRVTIWQGDDYLNGDDRAIEFTITNYAGPSLSGGSATLEIRRSPGQDRNQVSAAYSFDAASVSQASSTVTIRFTLTSAQSTALAARVWSYHLAGQTSGGSVISLADEAFEVR